jgi:hypothetical protein
MARDFLELGTSPFEEECVQVNPNVEYKAAMRSECERFIGLLESTLGIPPEGSFFTIKWSSHDFGSYADVRIVFDNENEAQSTYAYNVENSIPARWDIEKKISQETVLFEGTNTL